MFFTSAIADEYKQSLGISEHIYLLKDLLDNGYDKTHIGQIVFKNCADRIGHRYIESVVSQMCNLYSRYSKVYPDYVKFDIAILCKTPISKTTPMLEPSNVLGFIIAQKGECKQFPLCWTVNLICSNANKGKIMLGLYLYTILANPTVQEKMGMLELAGAFGNTTGMCMYSKFGFEYNHTLYGELCFADTSNMPMNVVVSHYSKPDMVDVVKGKLDLTPDNVKAFCKSRGRLQIALAICHNLKRYLQLGYTEEKLKQVQDIIHDGIPLYVRFLHGMMRGNVGLDIIIARIHQVMGALIKNELFPESFLVDFYQTPMQLQASRMHSGKSSKLMKQIQIRAKRNISPTHSLSLSPSPIKEIDEELPKKDPSEKKMNFLISMLTPDEASELKEYIQSHPDDDVEIVNEAMKVVVADANTVSKKDDKPLLLTLPARRNTHKRKRSPSRSPSRSRSQTSHTYSLPPRPLPISQSSKARKSKYLYSRSIKRRTLKK